jgi:hypothetical protein
MQRDNAGLFVSPPASLGRDAAVERLGELAARGEVFVGERSRRNRLRSLHDRLGSG